MVLCLPKTNDLKPWPPGSLNILPSTPKTCSNRAFLTTLHSQRKQQEVQQYMIIVSCIRASEQQNNSANKQIKMRRTATQEHQNRIFFSAGVCETCMLGGIRGWVAVKKHGEHTKKIGCFDYEIRYSSVKTTYFLYHEIRFFPVCLCRFVRVFVLFSVRVLPVTSLQGPTPGLLERGWLKRQRAVISICGF